MFGLDHEKFEKKDEIKYSGATKQLTTTVPIEIHAAIKKAGVPFNQIVISGWQAHQDFPVLKARIDKLEKANQTMQRYIYEITKR